MSFKGKEGRREGGRSGNGRAQRTRHREQEAGENRVPGYAGGRGPGQGWRSQNSRRREAGV